MITIAFNEINSKCPWYDNGNCLGTTIPSGIIGETTMTPCTQDLCPIFYWVAKSQEPNV